jgi:hypothetical protein
MPTTVNLDSIHGLDAADRLKLAQIIEAAIASASGINVDDHGTPFMTPASILDFEGVGVALTNGGGGKTVVTITGGGAGSNGINPLNKAMAANVTVADGDLACVPALQATPVGYVIVDVNGQITEVGNGVKTKACYFSRDGGVTPLAFGALVSTSDFLYWNGSIAGYQLAATDKIDFHYIY